VSRSRERWLGPAMLAPAILYVVALVGLPLSLAALYSVGDVRIGSSGWRFVGLQNFRSVVSSPGFRRALFDSFVFTVSAQALVLVGATLLALALKDSFRGRRWIRFVILLPWVAPVSLGAIGWKWILDSIYSVVNWVLGKLHLVNPFDPPMWLGEPTLAMASVILVHSWRMIPFSTVILLAGLTSIPKDIPEAAAVDGAGFWRTHFQITLPMMRPIITVAVLFGVVFTFTDMTVVYILTRGGPYDTTQVLPTLAFFTGVRGGGHAEGGPRTVVEVPAISVFLVPILVAVAALMLRVAHRAEVT
jgi:multiple sugar transport system permease protein